MRENEAIKNVERKSAKFYAQYYYCCVKYAKRTENKNDLYSFYVIYYVNKLFLI